jgi:hypothetical protein
LEAQKFLEEIQFIKTIGHDPEGVITYLIFGSKYEANDAFKDKIGLVIDFITSR